MHGLWAVTRQTFGQCLRTKIALVFIVLLAVVLGLLPLALKGDGTLAGKIQTFLTYSVAAISVLLSIVTVFMTVYVLSSDVQNKTIMTVATKPLPRWQYVVGRWAGVVLLDVLLLTIAGATAYAQLQWLRGGDTLNAEDRRKVESDIFVARSKVGPEEMDIQRRVNERIDKLRRDGALEALIDQHMQEAGGDREKGLQALEKALFSEMTSEMQSAEPAKRGPQGEWVADGKLTWEFTGIRVRGQALTASGRVVEAQRGVGPPPEPGRQPPLYAVLTVSAPRELMGRLHYGSSVRIGGRDAEIDDVEKGQFLARIRLPEITEGQPLPAIPGDLEKGSEVELVAEPLIQLQFRIDPVGSLEHHEVPARWRVTTPGRSES